MGASKWEPGGSCHSSVRGKKEWRRKERVDEPTGCRGIAFSTGACGDSGDLFAGGGGGGGVQGAQLNHADAEASDSAREQAEQHQHGDALKKRFFTAIRHG